MEGGDTHQNSGEGDRFIPLLSNVHLFVGSKNITMRQKLLASHGYKAHKTKAHCLIMLCSKIICYLFYFSSEDLRDLNE